MNQNNNFNPMQQGGMMPQGQMMPQNQFQGGMNQQFPGQTTNQMGQQVPFQQQNQGGMMPQGNQMMPQNQFQGNQMVPQGNQMMPQNQFQGNQMVPQGNQMMPQQGQVIPASGGGAGIFIIDDGGDGVLDDSDMAFVNNTTIYVIAMPLSSRGIGVQYGALNVQNGGVTLSSDQEPPTIFTKAAHVAATIDNLQQNKTNIFTQQFYQMNGVEADSDPVVIELEYGYKMRRAGAGGQGMVNNNDQARLQKILSKLTLDERQFLTRMAASGKIR